MRRAILAVVGLFACSAVHAQITTTRGGGGSGDDHSVIGNAIRALSDDQWGTVSGVGTFDPDPGNSNDSVFSYAQRGTYYDGKIYSFGGVHGSGGSETMFLNVYDLDSNTWVYQVHRPTTTTTTSTASTTAPSIEQTATFSATTLTARKR